MRTFTSAAIAAVLASTAAAAYLAMPVSAQSADPARDRVMTWADAKAKADSLWARLDVNKDGKLDQADRDARVSQMFDRIDANHDGSVSRDEFLANHRAVDARHARMEPGDQPPPAPPADGAAPPDRHGRSHWRPHGPFGMIGMADADRNGTVTRAEYDAAAKARFDKADTNHDGKITPDERRAAWRAMRRDGGPMGDMPPPPPPPPGA